METMLGKGIRIGVQLFLPVFTYTSRLGQEVAITDRPASSMVWGAK